MHKLQRRSTTEQVAELLRHAILTGQLAQGDQIRQERVAAQAGVSRIPVREALRQLEAEGLVHIEPHRGAVVAGLTTEELDETYEVRARLETGLLRQAIPLMGSADLDRAAGVADAMRQNTDEAAWSDLNWAFHAALVEPARRPWTVGLLRKVYLNVYRHFPTPICVTGNRERMLTDHDQLLVLCRDRDVDGAADLLEQHIIGSGASLIKHRNAASNAKEVNAPEEG